MPDNKSPVHLICGTTGGGQPACAFYGLPTSRQGRQALTIGVDDPGLGTQLHWLDVARDIGWKPVARRNLARPGADRFRVTREMFDIIDRLWEAPDAAELQRPNGTRMIN
jgi:hypothetical protein